MTFFIKIQPFAPDFHTRESFNLKTFYEIQAKFRNFFIHLFDASSLNINTNTITRSLSNLIVDFAIRKRVFKSYQRNQKQEQHFLTSDEEQLETVQKVVEETEDIQLAAPAVMRRRLYLSINMRHETRQCYNNRQWVSGSSGLGPSISVLSFITRLYNALFWSTWPLLFLPHASLFLPTGLKCLHKNSFLILSKFGTLL